MKFNTKFDKKRKFSRFMEENAVQCEPKQKEFPVCRSIALTPILRDDSNSLKKEVYPRIALPN